MYFNGYLQRTTPAFTGHFKGTWNKIYILRNVTYSEKKVG